jgi:hypothetical protein
MAPQVDQSTEQKIADFMTRLVSPPSRQTTQRIPTNNRHDPDTRSYRTQPNTEIPDVSLMANNVVQSHRVNGQSYND